MRNLLKILIPTFLISTTVLGQVDYIDVRKLPYPDCSGQTSIWTEFDKNKDRIMVIPDSSIDSISLMQIIELMPEKKIKKESELLDMDYNKSLEIYGLISEYKNWEKFNIPFKKIQNGFKYIGCEYQKAEDGFFFISYNRIVFSGNSYNIINQLLSTNVGYYEYIIIEEGLLSKFGLPNGELIDMNKITSTNYVVNSTDVLNLFIDKKLIFEPENLDWVEDICKTMELPILKSKINAFIHSDPNAVRLYANFWGMTGCDTIKAGTTINTVEFDAIHVYNINMETIRHEAFHLIWNEQVLNGIGGTLNSFYSEGIQEYYQQIKDSTRIYRNMQILKNHKDYDITNLVVSGSSQEFWGGPAENNWPIAYNISGLYVKFLIDEYGIQKFKDFYNIKDTKLAYTEIYNKEPEDVIKLFYNWTNSMNNGN